MQSDIGFKLGKSSIGRLVLGQGSQSWSIFTDGPDFSRYCSQLLPYYSHIGLKNMAGSTPRYISVAEINAVLTWVGPDRDRRVWETDTLLVQIFHQIKPIKT